VVIARIVTISIASIRHVYTYYKCDLTTLIDCKFMKLLFCYSSPHCQWYGEIGIFFQYFFISYVLLQKVAHIWALLTFHTCVTVFWGCTSWNTCILSGVSNMQAAWGPPIYAALTILIIACDPEHC